ncbi:uncharacterized protein N7506_003052 [Penicillium brevicompactum]|uniref:uncharacterized protein n=1 Tax=Penicillium brevicompactum TaxID=5074 RepID=UPI0025410ADA|nr:uncharacterized protein N7506_003052 [Penicillium brevicompactum]KAJ5343228.1 hypothetical protein N7506_003052 [Penicillium brevicompactum]
MAKWRDQSATFATIFTLFVDRAPKSSDQTKMSESPDPVKSATSEPPGDSSVPAPAHVDVEEKHDIQDEKAQAEEPSTDANASEKSKSSAELPESVEPEHDDSSAPPLPDEVPPPLPDEVPPPLPNEVPPTNKPEDDGWEPVWEPNMQAYYFYNRLTGASQWENPRVPETPAAPGTEPQSKPAPKKEPVIGGYNPAIHGDYDPTADYARQYEEQSEQSNAGAVDPTAAYGATGTFNRFTGRWQAADINPENHNDENKSRRQMNAFFDVDAAANSHDGRSLRAERSSRKLTKAELKQFKEKRREKKEEKRRAWLRD